MSKLLVKAPVIANISLTENVKQLIFHSPEIAAQAMPGQFLHVRVADSIIPLLRRPFGVAGVDVKRELVSIIYRVVGHGTAKLASVQEGEALDCMGPLGRGFDLDCQRPLLIGGGMGLAPLRYLAQRLCPQPIDILMGGRTRNEMFWPELFQQTCRNTHIMTDDGSVGMRGVTIDLLPALLRDGNYDMLYACGPRPMLAAIARLSQELGILCQISLEEYMACGMGACLSCTCDAPDGMRRKVCTDGPVFWAKEVVV